MPVPADADDDVLRAAARTCACSRETELYLGVLHLRGRRRRARAGGSRRRAATSTRSASATDCGWGRGGSAAVDGAARPAPRAVARLPIDAARAEDGRSRGPRASSACPTRTGRRADVRRGRRSPTTTSTSTAGTRTSTRASTQLAAHLRDGDMLMDYSGGTGILLDRLRLRIFERPVGALIVDASAKFLRVAHEKYARRPARRAAPAALHHARRSACSRSTRCCGPEIYERRVDAIAAVNAIHLYPDLDEVADGVGARAAARRQGVHQLRQPAQPARGEAGEWILDETVWVINDLAEGLVRSDPRYAQYRPVLDDTERMRAHAAHARPRVPQAAPARVLHRRADARGPDGHRRRRGDDRRRRRRVVRAHDGLPRRRARLGRRQRRSSTGAEPTPEAVEDRLAIMRHAIDTIFGGRETFNACWTYITAEKLA